MKYVVIFLVGVIFIFALLALELRTQAGRYQAYWTRRNKQPAMQHELVYIALGDSTAQGIGASKPEKSYPGLITAEMEKKTNRPVRLINLSKSGAKLDDVLQRQLPELKKCSMNEKTVITMEAGANDMGSFDLAKFENQMDEIMSKLPKQAVISDIPYFGGGIRRSLEPNVIKANEIMRRLAKKHDFKLADLHAKTKDNSGLRTFAVDLFHPSDYGYKANWAPAFMERINEQ